jgi:hypothetical protein
MVDYVVTTIVNVVEGRSFAGFLFQAQCLCSKKDKKNHNEQNNHHKSIKTIYIH